MAAKENVKCAKCGITSKENPSLTFHRFPLPSMHGPLKIKVWAKFCYPDDDWDTDESLEKLHKQHKMLCGNHFDDSSYTSSDRKRLIKFAIPVEAQNILHDEQLNASKEVHGTKPLKAKGIDQTYIEEDTDFAQPVNKLNSDNFEMPRKSAFKCYFGCSNVLYKGKFHCFPPFKYPYLEKFEQWKKVLSVKDKEKGDEYIRNNVYMCENHFEKFYITLSGRLTKNAVPTLNLGKFEATKVKEEKPDSPSTYTQSDSVSLTDLPDVENLKPVPETVADQVPTSIQILAGVSGQMISTNVSSVITPQSLLSNEIVTDFDMNDDSFQNDTTDDISPTTIDNETVTEQSSRAIIARVYKYLKKEYEYMKSVVGDSCDLSPMANILKRTAKATGVTEDIVTSIVEEPKSTEHHIKLEHIIDEESSNELCHEYLLKNFKETDMESDTDEVLVIDLRANKPINLPKLKNPTARLQSISKKSKLPTVKLIKSSLPTRSPLTEYGRKTIRSDILDKLPHCQWCIVRQRQWIKVEYGCVNCAKGFTVSVIVIKIIGQCRDIV